MLAGLGVDEGVVAITKTDRADPGRASAQAAKLLPGVEIVPCSARTGDGVAASPTPSAASPAAWPVGRRDRGRRSSTSTGSSRSRARERSSRGRCGRAGSPAATSSFSSRRGREVRVRSVQVHDEAVETADAGQRVAVNLSGIGVRELSRGDALVSGDSEIEPTTILDCALDLGAAGRRRRAGTGPPRDANGRRPGDRAGRRPVAGPPGAAGPGRPRRSSGRPVGRPAGHARRGNRARPGRPPPRAELACGRAPGARPPGGARTRTPAPAADDPRKEDEPEPLSESAVALAERSAGSRPSSGARLGARERSRSNWPRCGRPGSPSASAGTCTPTGRRSKTSAGGWST